MQTDTKFKYWALACFRVKHDKMMSSLDKAKVSPSDYDTRMMFSANSVQNIWLDTRYKFNVDLVFVYRKHVKK